MSLEPKVPGADAIGMTRVEVEERVAEYVTSHGGNLYVWRDEAGLEHVSLKPQPAVEFESVEAAGFAVHFDTSIETPDVWKLVFHRFPVPHVRALWNGFAQQAGQWGGNPRWEGGSPSYE